MFRWVSITPLGFPVEPDVKIILARLVSLRDSEGLSTSDVVRISANDVTVNGLPFQSSFGFAMSSARMGSAE